MKKFVVVTILALMLFAFSYANNADATLLGVRTGFAGFYPKISFDGGGLLVYDAGTDKLDLTAADNKYIAGPGDYDNLYDKVDLTLSIHVDSTGKFTGGVSGYDMVETVKAGESVTIRGNTYVGGDILLQGNVVAFGWGTAEVDYHLDDLAGKLVDDGLWPGSPPNISGLYATLDDTPDWSGDFELGAIEGKKMPTPEPTTMLLLGFGLAGLAGYAWRRKKKQS
jgi:hypothetical protein